MPSPELVTLERAGAAGMAPDSIELSRFPFLIGRGPDCDLRICDPWLSRSHCQLEWRDGALVVEDLESRNGTEVNGEEITEPYPLVEGDLLRVGTTVFAVRLHAEASAGRRRRVLVVEDDAVAAGTLALLLREWGHEVEVAGDGDRALEAARACPPDTVLLDLNLGNGPNGLEVAHRLRDEIGLRGTRLVAVTGQPPQGKVSRDLDGVLVKPVDVRTLRQALAAAN
jgi:CheY-like chemotaxis protein